MIKRDGSDSPEKRRSSKRLRSSKQRRSAPADFSKYEGNPDFVLSVARGLKVIEAFEGNVGGLSASEIAQYTGFSRAAVRRFLLTLELLGYAETDGRVYSLKAPVLKLGFSYLSSTSLPAFAQSLTERLAEVLHESASVSVLAADQIVYVARASAKRVMSIGLSIGSRLPAYCTSMGRVQLAALPDPVLEEYLNRVQLKPMTARTVTDKARFAALIQEVRVNGFALSDEELEVGLRSLAVPVRSRTGHVVAAMNIGVHAAQISRSDLLEKFLPALRESGQMLGEILP